MMALNAYWAYGLRIHAELMCPELPPLVPSSLAQKTGEPDVTIHLLSAVSDASQVEEPSHYEVQPGVFHLTIPDVARYRVEDGRRIFIEPLAGASPEKVRLFLFGSVMGALLYQRGLFPLHGSAVETRWGAMIFVGAQGAGKSTLASQFHRKGYRLLSDDVCAMASTSDGLQILPALAKFRLCADAYERLGAPSSGQFDVDKFVVPMGEGYCPHPVALCAIHILRIDDSPDSVHAATPGFEVLTGFDRVQRLLENLYRPHYLKGQQTQASLMRMAGEIAQKATLVTVSRRRNPTRADELVGFLESNWSARFDAIHSGEKN
jgi:hypothetical protein